jgi:hypothetical protein
MESKYLALFKAQNDAKVLPNIKGATLVVECLPKKELKSAGGIILGAVDKTHRGTLEDNRRGLAIILAVGEGYSSDEPCTLKPGQVVMLPFSPLYLSEWPGIAGSTMNTIALINESDVLIVYDSLDAIIKAEQVTAG